MIRVLIVAAYASVRAGLHVLLAESGDCGVVGEATSSGELERLLPRLRPDVALCDVNTGDLLCLLEALEESETGLVVLSENPAETRLLANSPLRGWAWLRKDTEGPEIVGAVQAASAGLIALDRSLDTLLSSATPLDSGDQDLTETLPGETLTTREREVLQLMAQGLPNKQIAAKLSISLSTVKFHVASVLAKLGASSRTEAVTLGARRGHILL